MRRYRATSRGRSQGAPAQSLSSATNQELTFLVDYYSQSYAPGNNVVGGARITELARFRKRIFGRYVSGATPAMTDSMIDKIRALHPGSEDFVYLIWSEALDPPGDVNNLTTGQATLDMVNSFTQNGGWARKVSGARFPWNTGAATALTTDQTLTGPRVTCVKAATTGNVAISSLTPGAVVDDVTVGAGDLVLVRANTAAAQNAVILVGTTPARVAGFTTFNDHPGAIVVVMQGTTNARKSYTCSSASGGTLGTTAINWTNTHTVARAPARQGVKLYFTEYAADYFWELHKGCAKISGLFIDNLQPVLRGGTVESGNFLHDGVDRPYDNSAVRSAHLAGLAAGVNRLRSNMATDNRSTLKITCNGSTNDAQLDGALSGLTEGCLIENFGGTITSWALQNYLGFTGAMARIATMMGRMTGTKQMYLMMNSDTANFQKWGRYGMAAALMKDGVYFGIYNRTIGHARTFLDEYLQPRGSAIDPEQTDKVTGQEYWMRRFQKGMVILLPFDASVASVTVTVEANKYRRIGSGTIAGIAYSDPLVGTTAQDPTVNSGGNSYVTTVTVNRGDAIYLRVHGTT